MTKPKITCTSKDTTRYKTLTESYPHLLDKYDVPLCVTIRRPVDRTGKSNQAQLWQKTCPACEIIDYLNKMINSKQKSRKKDIKEIHLESKDIIIFAVWNSRIRRAFVVVDGIVELDITRKFKNYCGKNAIEVEWNEATIEFGKPKMNQLDTESIDQINRLINKLLML